MTTSDNSSDISLHHADVLAIWKSIFLDSCYFVSWYCTFLSFILCQFWSLLWLIFNSLQFTQLWAIKAKQLSVMVFFCEAFRCLKLTIECIICCYRNIISFLILDVPLKTTHLFNINDLVTLDTIGLLLVIQLMIYMLLTNWCMN